MMTSTTFIACGDSDDEQEEWNSPDDDNNNSDPTYQLVKIIFLQVSAMAITVGISL